MPRYSPRTGQLTEYQAGPFDQAHIYLQWGGKLPSNESWSCGMRFFGPAASAETDATAMLVPVSAAVVAFHQRVGSKIGTNAKLSFVKVNGINTAGHYISEATNQALYADLAGGSPQSPHAHQIALAVSLTTGFSRGPAHRGRIYLPAPCITVEADGLFPEADVSAVKTSFLTFRTALNAAHTDWELAVFSRKAGAPGHRAITGVEIGRVPDTQRRRRRSLLETYV